MKIMNSVAVILLLFLFINSHLHLGLWGGEGILWQVLFIFLIQTLALYGLFFLLYLHNAKRTALRISTIIALIGLVLSFGFGFIAPPNGLIGSELVIFLLLRYGLTITAGLAALVMWKFWDKLKIVFQIIPWLLLVSLIILLYQMISASFDSQSLTFLIITSIIIIISPIWLIYRSKDLKG